MMTPRWTIGFAAVLALALAGCNAESKAETQPPEPQKEFSSVPVRTVTARAGALESARTVSGTLAAAIDSAVVAEASGRVVAVLRKPGDRVKAGEVVLQLESATLRDQLEDARLAARAARVTLETAERQNPEDRAQAKKRLAAARTALENANRIATANAELYAMGGVAEVELRNSRTQADQAAAELEAAQAALARLERAGTEGLKNLQLAIEQADTRVRQLERDLGRSNVKAPFAGELAEVVPQVGEFLASGARAFRLLDLGQLRVNFSVPASDASKLEVGRGVSVKIGSRTLTGRVSRNGGVPGDDRLVKVEARFVGGQALSGLRPGGTAKIGYRLKLGAGVLVPTGALRIEQNTRSVLIVKNGVAAERPVRVIAESAGRVIVDGVAAGASVIYPVPSNVAAGKAVKVVGGQP